MKRSIIITSIILCSYVLSAQYAGDALRYSQNYYQGTARSMAAGNALGAMGGDFSILSTNPAGIGVFRSSSFTISPEIVFRRASSAYNGSYAEDNRTVFDLSNVGYVLSKPLGRSGWKYFNFAFGMNRLNNYNTNTVVNGDNAHHSKLDIYLDDALEILNNGGSVADIASSDPFYLAPAWDTYLLDTVSDENYLYLFTPVPFGGVNQKEIINTRGSTNEWLVSFGANYNDVLFIGATLGMPYLRYFSDTYYSETDVRDTIPYFNSWRISESLTTFSWGINLKLGVLIKPADWIRIGGAFHTPTSYWNMYDSWRTVTTSDLQWSEGVLESVSPTGNYDYQLTTPMRAIGNLGFVIGNMGFISGEYEFVDYTRAKFRAHSYGFSDENQNIKEFYTSVHNIRLGTEWRIKQLSLRAGYALYGSPYKNNSFGARRMISGGIGYQIGGFAIDLAYVNASQDAEYYLYSSANYQTNAATQNLTDYSVVLGLRFMY